MKLNDHMAINLSFIQGFSSGRYSLATTKNISSATPLLLAGYR